MPAAAIVRLDAVDSTQRVAFELAADGAADRTVVVADHQVSGRGRRGRTWHAEPGTSLLMSIVVRPNLAAPETPLLSFVAAVAVAEAIVDVAGASPRLKWPNDVLLDGRKVAGILLEARQATDVVVAIGIGLNLRQMGWPEAVRDRATSVRLATGVDVPTDAALAALLARFDAWREELETRGFARVRARWVELADTIGRDVTIDGVSGRAIDLAADGALIVDDGVRHRRIVSGEIEAATAAKTVSHAAGR